MHDLVGLQAAAAVPRLLQSGADVHATDDEGLTALHLAAFRGDLTSAKLLLAAGARIGARDRIGMTPLHHAARCVGLQLAPQRAVHPCGIGCLHGANMACVALRVAM